MAYTHELLEKRSYIKNCLERAWGENKKTLNEVLTDFMDLLWRYYSFDNAIYRFWSSLDACIDNYFESRMYKVPVCTATLFEEWLHFHYLKESGDKETISIINNKASFREFYARHGLPVCKRLGILEWRDGNLCFNNMDGSCSCMDSLFDGSRTAVFCKPALDCQGHGCLRLEYEGSVYRINGNIATENDLADHFSTPKLVEDILVNHQAIRAIHPASLNTCRLITMKEDDGTIRLFRAVMRIGVGGSSVDNWCSGGLAVAIDDGGKLSEYALYEDYAKADTPVHPDTGVVFKGMQLSYYNEAVELALQAHCLCPSMKSVGWDVAITEKGPLLVEGNVFYETFQAVCGGLREDMRVYMSPAH